MPLIFDIRVKNTYVDQYSYVNCSLIVDDLKF